MRRMLAASFVVLTGLAAASAGAREYRFFDAGDRVFYRPEGGRVLEAVVEPHLYLARAERAFDAGHRAAAAEYLEKAAVGFGYFSERAAGTDRRQLDLAGRALARLARDVRRGDVDEVTTLQRAVADARRALAGEAATSAPAAAPAAPQPS